MTEKQETCESCGHDRECHLPQPGLVKGWCKHRGKAYTSYDCECEKFKAKVDFPFVKKEYKGEKMTEEILARSTNCKKCGVIMLTGDLDFKGDICMECSEGTSKSK